MTIISSIILLLGMTFVGKIFYSLLTKPENSFDELPKHDRKIK